MGYEDKAFAIVARIPGISEAPAYAPLIQNPPALSRASKSTALSRGEMVIEQFDKKLPGDFLVDAMIAVSLVEQRVNNDSKSQQYFDRATTLVTQGLSRPYGPHYFRITMAMQNDHAH